MNNYGTVGQEADWFVRFRPGGRHEREQIKPTDHANI